MDKIYFRNGILTAFILSIHRQLYKTTIAALLLSFICISAQAQSVVTGVVKDANGITLIGVNVRVKTTTSGTSTGNNGEYSIKVPNSNAILQFTYIGYVSKEVSLAGKTTLNIVLEDESTKLNEVVVVGYGAQKKSTLTGATSQISAEEIMKSPAINVTNSLIGKLPGLQAVQSSGQPGADAATIKIRGAATFNNSTAIVVVDGIERPSFGDIDPNEIETITVLKDAASTAIYGIKGANGVIVITTKQGKIGKPQVTYTGNYALQTYTGLPIGLGSYDNARLQDQAFKNDGATTLPWTDAELQKFKDGSDPYGYPDVKWFDYLTKKFYMQTQHNINISGGTKVARYFVSAGYAFQDGIFKKFDSPYGINSVPNNSRYNFRSNLDLTLSKDLTVSIKLGGRFSQRYQPSGLLSTPTSATASNFSYDTIEGLISRILQVPSYAYPVTLPDGRIAQNPGVGTNLWNPLAVLTRFGTRYDDNNTIESTFNINYKLDFITKGLSFKTNFGYDSYYTNVEHRNANWAAYVWDRLTGAITLSPDRTRDEPLGGIITSGSSGTPPSGSTTTSIQSGFYYNRSFGQHNVSGLLLGVRQFIQGPTNTLISSVLTSPPQASQGIVGRITYNYAERYFLEFNGAYNGSENFEPESYGPPRQYGFFPAISAGWTLSNEKFFPKNKVITYVKFRGSYGLVGNDKLGDNRFLFLTSYGPGSSAVFGSPTSTTSFPTNTVSALGNPEVTWETGTKRNLGLETRFLNDKLKLTVDIFDETRRDILQTPKSGLLSFGYTYPKLNVGKVYNKGYEIELDYQGRIGQVALGINGQLSYAKNVVLNNDEPAGLPEGMKVAGKSIDQFTGYVTEGFYKDAADVANSPKPAGVTPIPGDLKFKDTNGDGVITPDDFQAIGYSTNPEYIYSFTPRVAYKDITLSVQFQGVAHVSSKYILTEQNNGQQMYPFMLNSWTPDNAATATWPALHSRGYTGSNYISNDFILQNAAYLKIRNVELAYTLPKRWTNALKLAGVRVYVNGTNLYTWTPFKMYVDPENLNMVNQTFPVTAVYPSSRVFNVGLNINF